MSVISIRLGSFCSADKFLITVNGTILTQEKNLDNTSNCLAKNRKDAAMSAQ